MTAKPIPTAKPLAKPVAKPIAKPVAKEAPVAAPAETEAKPKKVYAKEIPAFLYSSPADDGTQPIGTTAEGATEENQGTVLLVKREDKPKAAPRPIKLAKIDFPRNRDGRIAFWDYKIAVCEFFKSKAVAAGDETAKKRKKFERMQAAMAELAAELGVDLATLLAQAGK